MLAALAFTLTVSWVDNSQIEDGYVLLRRAHNQKSFYFIQQLPANARCFRDTTTQRNVRYEYLIGVYKGEERQYGKIVSNRDIGRSSPACR